MPNYVNCRLIISSEEGECAAVHALMGDGFDFNAILPYPEHFRKRDEEVKAMREANPKVGLSVSDGYNSGGYEWCRENWGTKWNVGDAKFDANEWRFDTAWSPPLPVIRALCAKFPAVQFELHWFERGSATAGVFTWSSEDGEHHHTFEYQGFLGG